MKNIGQSNHQNTAGNGRNFNTDLSSNHAHSHAESKHAPKFGENGLEDHRFDADQFESSSLNLTEDEASGLLYMIEEEKMARDLYDAFAEQTGSLIFERISDSEQQHLDALLMVADAAGIDVPELLEQPGTFHNPTIQNLYNTLLAQGSVSLAEAIAVGIAVEETDIYDLQQLVPETEISMLGVIYDHLLTGSQNHLDAFSAF